MAALISSFVLLLLLHLSFVLYILPANGLSRMKQFFTQWNIFSIVFFAALPFAFARPSLSRPVLSSRQSSLCVPVVTALAQHNLQCHTPFFLSHIFNVDHISGPDTDWQRGRFRYLLLRDYYRRTTWTWLVSFFCWCCSVRWCASPVLEVCRIYLQLYFPVAHTRTQIGINWWAHWESRAVVVVQATPVQSYLCGCYSAVHWVATLSDPSGPLTSGTQCVCVFARSGSTRTGDASLWAVPLPPSGCVPAVGAMDLFSRHCAGSLNFSNELSSVGREYACQSY